jgi:hypothetical protein
MVWSDDDIAAFDSWLSAHPKVVAQCWYHRQGYDRSMRLAVRAMRELCDAPDWGNNADGTRRSSFEAIEASLLADDTLDRREIEMAAVLVSQPICWSGTSYLTDGQHRMCVVRAADLQEVVVLAR